MKRYIPTIVTLILVLIIGSTMSIMAHQLSRPAVTTRFPNRIQEVLPSVVHIMCDRWQGSGVVISEDIIVTARHIIDGTDYTITLHNGVVLKGIQAISHKDYDVGFIKVDISQEVRFAAKVCGQTLLVPAKFGSIKDCVLGQPLFVIGSMAGKDNFNSISLGIVSGLNRGGNWKGRTEKDLGWSVLLQTDAEGMGGSSGCPIFTMDGIVRGIWVGSTPPAVHYSIPVDVFLNDIEGIKLMFAFEKYRIEKEVKLYNEWGEYN